MERSDAELLAATSRGDQDAFGEFFRRHEAAVTRFALRRSSSPDEVGDAVAETFLVALRQADRYNAQSPSAAPWLFGIAHRVLSQQARGLRRRMRLSSRLASMTPTYSSDEHERIVAALDAERRVTPLRPVIARLPRRERDVLELIVLADLSPSEAALALGISANAARTRLTRARRRLAAEDISSPPSEVPCARTT